MTHVNLTILEAGSCEQLETLVLRTKTTRKLRFPAIYALIRHPERGAVLFDAGYSAHVLELTRRWPERIYTLTLPIDLPAEDDPKQKLQALGVAPDDVKHVFLSHFHVDHVGALRDLPCAEFIFHEPAWDAVKDLGRVAGLRKAYIGALIPDDFDRRARPFTSTDFGELPDEYAPFERGFDVFDDGSLIAVELPGHAAGQMGLFVQTEEERVFLCADACWTSRSYAENILPARVAEAVFDDWDDYARSLELVHRFHEQHPEVRVIPSHCQRAWEELPGHLRFCPGLVRRLVR